MAVHFAEIPGGALRYELARPEAGAATLILIHEMGNTLEGWDAVLPLLPPDLPFLRYDWRGMGLSTKLVGDGDIDEMVRDLDALLDVCGRTGPVLTVGGAIGGAIALRYAARRARTAGVIALGPAVGVPPERRAATLQRASRIEREGMIAIAEEELALVYPEALRHPGGPYPAFRARWLGNDARSYAATYRMICGTEMADDLATMAPPAIVLAGEMDVLRPPSLVEPQARTMPNARFRAVPTGHFMATQAPELVAATIVEFAAELGLTGAPS